MPIRKWDDTFIIGRALDVAEGRMRTATALLEGEVKKTLNRSNARGRSPSVPGEAPRKRTGELQRSIFSRVMRTNREVTGAVGSSSISARRLELGFSGKDSMGRRIDQAPRPFLRSTLLRMQTRLQKILGAK